MTRDVMMSFLEAPVIRRFQTLLPVSPEILRSSMIPAQLSVIPTGASGRIRPIESPFSAREQAREQGSAMLGFGLWGSLTVLAAIAEAVFATCVFIYIRGLENRTPAALGERVGAHKAILAKVRKGEPMSQEEMDYATELVRDARNPLAFAIPGALFC